MGDTSSGGGHSMPHLRYSSQQADTHSLNSKELPPVPKCMMSAGAKMGSSPQQHGEQDWEIPPAALSLGTVLGEGEFGIVHKGRWNGTPVAIKVLKAMNQRHRAKIALEVDVLRRLRHPNVVEFLGACTRSNPVTIVSELLEGGSLGDALQARPQPPLRRVLEIALDCARGLNCLHCAFPYPILHRDLKPDNVMLARSHASHTGDALTEAGVAKLADFGLSRIIAAQPAVQAAAAYPPAPPSHPPAPRTSCSDSVDIPLPSGAVTPSSTGSWAAHDSERGGGDLDLTGADDVFMPRPSGSYTPPSLQAHTSSAGGFPGAPAHTPCAVSSEGGEEAYRMTGGTGSYSYMAPEVFRHEPYNAKADVYSLAMVMYEMLAGRRPFVKVDPKEAARRVAREGVRPKWKSPPKEYSAEDRAALPDVQAFVERCWAGSPAARPSCSDAIVELERLISSLGHPRKYSGSGPASEGRWRRPASLNLPNPARVVDSVQDLTTKTLSRFGRSSPERITPSTPQHGSDSMPTPHFPRSTGAGPMTSPIDVPDAAPVPAALRRHPRTPQAQGMVGSSGADAPPAIGSLGRGVSPLVSGSLPLHKSPIAEYVTLARKSRGELSASPPMTGGMAERRKAFLKRLKRVGRKGSDGLRTGETSADSAVF
eukprot:jgi/Ulvmu1/11522/UM078_0011.1